jgi:tetratricopeptide (TPR) repeat protein
MLVYAQHYVALCLINQKKFAESQAVYERSITEHPAANVGMLSGSQLGIANCLMLQGKYTEAQGAAAKVLTSYPAAQVSKLATAQNTIGDCLKAQGKPQEAQVAYMTAIKNYAWQLGAKDENTLIWVTFDKLNPQLSTSADYKAFLEDAIKVVKATEDNAKFLGLLKSELGKMQ